MRICSGAGCLRAVADDVRYCDECKPTSQPTEADGIRSHTLTDRERYAHLYSSGRWTRLRASVARQQPFCARCQRAVTTIVDHVVPAGVVVVQVRESGLYGDPNAGFFMRSNLCGMCRPCHWLKTDEDKAHVGPWPSVLEADNNTTKRVFSF